MSKITTSGPARMRYKISASVNSVLIKYVISCSDFIYYSFKFLFLTAYFLETDVNMNILTLSQAIYLIW